MARPKGHQNKSVNTVAPTILLTTEERITFIANLITEKIFEDLTTGKKIYKQIAGKSR